MTNTTTLGDILSRAYGADAQSDEAYTAARDAHAASKTNSTRQLVADLSGINHPLTEETINEETDRVATALARGNKRIASTRKSEMRLLVNHRQHTMAILTHLDNLIAAQGPDDKKINIRQGLLGAVRLIKSNAAGTAQEAVEAWHHKLSAPRNTPKPAQTPEAATPVTPVSMVEALSHTEASPLSAEVYQPLWAALGAAVGEAQSFEALDKLLGIKPVTPSEPTHEIPEVAAVLDQLYTELQPEEDYEPVAVPVLSTTPETKVDDLLFDLESITGGLL